MAVDFVNYPQFIGPYGRLPPVMWEPPVYSPFVLRRFWAMKKSWQSSFRGRHKNL